LAELMTMEPLPHPDSTYAQVHHQEWIKHEHFIGEKRLMATSIALWTIPKEVEDLLKKIEACAEVLYPHYRCDSALAQRACEKAIKRVFPQIDKELK